MKLGPQEKRRLIAKALRDAADFVEAQESEPVSIGPLVWNAMLALEQKAREAEEADEQALREQPPAA